MSDRKMVFVVTYGRSGSTLVQRVLQTVPDSCIRGENNNVLFHLYGAWKSIAEVQTKRNGKKAPATSPWHGIDKVDAEAFAIRLGKVFVEKILRPNATDTLVGFKEIRYHNVGDELPAFLKFITWAFPGARLIFNTRNLDEVLNSSWWAERDPAKVRGSLTKAEAMFKAHADQHPESAYAITYEDMTGRTERFWGLFDFLEITPDKEAVEAVLGERLTHAKGPRAKREKRIQ